MRTLVQLIVSLLFLLTSSISYSSTIQDRVGKSDNASFSQIEITGNVSPVACYGGNDGYIDITVTGGVSPYTFLWSNNQATEDIFSLSTGSYSVTVTDAENYIASASFVVNGSTQVIQLSGFSVNASCYNGNDGGISLTTSGGNPPYSWLWNDGDTTEDRNGLQAGNYFVVVTDFGGNCSQMNFTINQAAEILANPVITNNTCFGAHDGAIEVLPSHGYDPYTFLWSTGSTSSMISGLTAGDYTVSITDANNCISVTSIQITQPVQVIQVDHITSDITCFGLSNGSIDLTISGGEAPYSINWNTGSTSEDLQYLPQGEYFVIVTDAASNCSKAYFTINEPMQLLVDGIATNPACNMINSGAIDLTVTGGVMPYSFLWDNGSTSEDLNSIYAGDYSVVVTDANGCTAATNFTLTQPDYLSIQSSTTDISCYGGHNGAVNITISGGTFPYSYFWSNGSNAEDISNLSSGEYSVTVLDANGCMANAGPFNLSQPTALTLTDSTIMVSCHGANNGQIYITAHGGAPVYHYTWNDWASTQHRTNLQPGQYTVTITDSHYCTVWKSIIITQPSGLNIQSQVTNATCFGMANGSISLTVNGGVSPYTYIWYDQNTNKDRSNLTAGLYSVTVTDYNGCTNLLDFNITQPDSLYFTTQVTNISCYGANNGMIDVTVEGGTSPFQFLWDDGINTEDRNNLLYGIYYLTISDANGCSNINHAVVLEPSSLILNDSITQVKCFGENTGSVFLKVDGGTSPYSYLWSNGSTQQSLDNIVAGTYSVTISDVNNCHFNQTYTITQPTEIILTSNVLSVKCFGNGNGSINLNISGSNPPYTYLWNNGLTTKDLSDLIHAVYTITVTDSIGCTKTVSYEITEPEILKNTAIETSISCNGLADGAIDLSVTGGTAPYIYEWSNAATTQDISGLSVGTYMVTITDHNDCQSFGTYTITQPDVLVLSATQTPVTCNNGSNGIIDLTVAGGTATYSYLWSNGLTTEDLSGLIPDDYSVTVTDQNNCSETLDLTVVNPANVVQASNLITPVSCPNGINGIIDLTITAGTAPFNFLWSNESINEDLTGVAIGNYSVTITDAGSNCSVYHYEVTQVPEMQISEALVHNICHSGTIGEIDITVTGGTSPYTFAWSNGATNEDLTNLVSGPYTVTVTDVNQCSITSTWEINQPSAVTVAETISDVSCNGGNNGEISIIASGGTPDYTYLWSTASISNSVTGLTANVYSVTVTDHNLCNTVFNYTVNEPATLALTTNVDNTSCFAGTNGTIDLTVSGGIAPYTFLWNNGSSDEDISQLPAGNYSVTVVDNNGCSTVLTSIVNEPVQVVFLTADISPVSCIGGNNGSINTTATGGTEPYTYSWNNGNTIEDIESLTAGSYIVTVTDANGFCSVVTFSVSEVTPMNIISNVTNVSCNGLSNGAIELSVTNGNSPYSFLWSNQSVDQNISGLPAGIYDVTVTDFAGCSQIVTIPVTEPEECVVTADITNTTCFGSGSGIISLNVTGGTAPYKYLWETGSTEDNVTNLFAGDYTVTVTDDNGCSTTETFTVGQFSNVTGIISNSYQVLNCSGDNIIPFEFIPDNYLPEEVTYTWVRNNTANVNGMPANGPGPASGSLTNISNYPAVVNFTFYPSYNGCQGAPLQATVIVPAAFTAVAVADPILCSGGLSTVHVTGSGGTQPYNNAATFTSQSGYHEFSILDYNGCSATASITIPEPEPISIISSVTNNFCQHGTNGAITLTTTGGTPPYSFLWNDGNTNEFRSNMATGIYHVTVTDVNGCEATHTAQIFYSHITATAFMTTEPIACQGLPHPFTVYLTGTKPFMLQYTDFTDTITVMNINSFEYDFNVNIMQNSQYKLVSVADIMCAGNVYGETYHIQSEPVPTGEIASHTPVCPGEATQLEVNLTGQAPWNITWFDGTSHDVDNIFQSPYYINVSTNTTTTYSLTAVSDSYCNATNLGAPMVLLVNDKPTASITGTTTICGGQVANLQVHLTGTPPWTIVVNNEAIDTTISDITSSPYTFAVTPDYSAIYTIVSVTDNSCSSTGTGSATVTVYERPYAHIEGPSNTCFGNSSNLFFNLSGTPPWHLTWTDGQITHSLTNILTSPVMITVGPDTTATYYLTQLADLHCNALIPSDTFKLNIADPPTAELTGPSTSCFGIGTDLFVNLTGTPPWTIIWNDTATHVVTGILETPYIFHVDPSSVTNYWITHITDASCNGNSIGFPLTISVVPTADVALSGINNVNQVCSGGSVSIYLAFTNALPPFSIAYFDETNTQHIVSGITQDTTITIFPPTDAGSYNYTFLYVSDENGCSHNYNIPFNITVLPLPYVNAGSDTLISYGQSIVLLPTISGGAEPYNIQWSPAAYLSNSTILNPVSSPMTSITYTLSVTDNNGCSNSDQILVDVNVTRTIYGTITYDNAEATPLNNVTVFALNGTDTVASAVSNQSGFYEITNLPDGNYHLKFLCTKPLGGVNATDAMIILKHFVQLSHLTGIRKICADVDGTQYVNSADALYVSKRFTGQLSSFTIGDWVFQNTVFTIPTLNPEYNILGICSGDANGSYIPAAKISPAINIETKGVIQTQKGMDVIIPFSVNRQFNTNAMSLIMEYPADNVTITNIVAPGLKDISYTIQNGTIRISWYNLETKTLLPEEPVFLIHATVLSNYSETADFTITGESEFADFEANQVNNTSLIYPKLVLSGDQSFSSTIFPNPVKDQMAITLNIPREGRISIRISNLLGDQVTISKDVVYPSGIHTINFDASGLTPGIYNYTVDYNNGVNSESKSEKFIIIR